MTSRRNFFKQFSLTVGGIFIGATHPVLSYPEIEHSFGSLTHSSSRKLGIALVGLGQYSTDQLGPALLQTKNCKLSGIVTGSPEKIPSWKKKYNLSDKNIYNYENFDKIADNKDIDIVYIVLPNAMHAEYTIRAAKAGKHVICEKPMAVSVEECQLMIDACNKAGVKLSIGYRLHFEPFNLEMMRLGQNKVFGKINKIDTANGFVLNDKVWRADKKLAGGGPLMDLGIYCVQGSIYTTGMNPIAVTAKEGKKTKAYLFKDVEQSISWDLEFPDGIVAHGETSYADSLNKLRAEAEQGWFELAPAFPYAGLKGQTSNGPMNFPQVYEQVFQMDDFADCILTNRKSKVSGEMGLRDMQIIDAIYKSAATGQRIVLNQIGLE